MERTAGMDHTVARDVEVVPDVGKASCQVVTPAILQRVVAVTPCSAAMQHNQVYQPVILILAACQDGHAHRAQPPIQAWVVKDVAIAVNTVMMMRSTLLHTDSFEF